MSSVGEEATSSWLAQPKEIRELHGSSSTPVRSPRDLPPPPPPPPPPHPRETEKLVAMLLESGVFLAANDSRTGGTYYYSPSTSVSTWQLARYAEVHYYDLLPLVGTNVVASGRTSKLVSTPPRTASAGRHASPLLQRIQRWRAKIVALYEAHDPSKVDLVDELMMRYRGQEEELWLYLQAKYAVPGDDAALPPNSSTASSSAVAPRESPRPRTSLVATASLSAGSVARIANPRNGGAPGTKRATATVSLPRRTASGPAVTSRVTPPRAPPQGAVHRHPHHHVDPNEDDQFMHKHHGDTHAVSYHSSPPRSASSPSPEADDASLVPPPSPKPKREEKATLPVQPRAEGSAIPASATATPDVSTIAAQSEPEEVQEQRQQLARARAAAEAKALQVLAKGKSRSTVAESPRATAVEGQTVPSNTQSAFVSPTVPPPPPLERRTWIHELGRRDEELAARKVFVQQQRIRAKQAKDEEMKRRAVELQKIRDAEASLKLDLQMAAAARASGTPRRSSVEPDGSARRPSPLARTASSPPPAVGVPPIYPSSLGAVRSPSPQSSKKLTPREQRESVDRLYRNAAR